MLPASVVASVIIARILGPEGKGLFQALMLYGVLLANIGLLGVQMGFNYYLLIERFSVGDQFVTIVFTVAAWSALYSVLLYVLHSMGVLTGALTNIFFLIALLLLIPIRIMISFLLRMFPSKGDFIGMNILSSATTLVPVIVALLVLLFGLGINGVLVVAAIVMGAMTVGAIGMLLRDQKVNRRINWRFLPEAYSYGLRGYGQTIFSFANLRLDQTILSFVSVAQLGIYSVAVQLSEITWFVTISMSQILKKHVAISDDRTAVKIVNRLTRISVLLGALFAVFLLIVGGPLIRLIYGGKFGAAPSALYLLLPGTVLNIYGRYFGVYLAAKGFPGLNSTITFIGSAVSIVLYLILIPLYGIDGAALASSIGYTMTSVVAWYFYRQKTGSRWQDIVIVTGDDIRFVTARMLRITRQILDYVTRRREKSTGTIGS